MPSDEQVKPGNIAMNMGNILKAQQDAVKEETIKEQVKERLDEAKKEEDIDKPKKEDKKPMVFGGFQYNLESSPKSEVHLGITNADVRFTPIIYREEVDLAQTIVKEEDLFMEILKLLYKHISEGPDRITKSFDDFLTNVVEKDSKDLLYGFHLVSYGPEVEIKETLVCQECGQDHKVEKLNLIDLYECQEWEGEPFHALDELVELDLTDCELPGTKFYFRFPSLLKTTEAKTMSKSNFLHEIANNAISNFMAKFTMVAEDETILEYSDPKSLKNAIETLGVKARKKVKKFLEDRFFKYGVKLIYRWECNNKVKDEDALDEKATKLCKHKNELEYNINDLFFREISESVS